MKKHFLIITALLLGAASGVLGQGSFCGAVGSEGCDAIKYDSTLIIGWATGCTVERGPADITDPSIGYVFYGNESMAVGPATTVTTTAVSLGDGGTALLTFARPIANGPGPDFAVFENSFNDNFLELAFVEVSTDGERYVRFPSTSLTPTATQVGSYGSVDPTNLNNLAGKYRVGYGTPFDLEELRDSAGIDLDSIVYVRLVDVVGCINPEYATYDAFGHIVNDPWPTNDMQYGSGGFDLTGVAVIHDRSNVGITDFSPLAPSLRVYPNPATDRLNVVCQRGGVQARLIDQSGRVVRTVVLADGVNAVDVSGLSSGIYVLLAEGSATKVVKR